jgi:ribonucleoside-diphosphate reductase alpha chain
VHEEPGVSSDPRALASPAAAAPAAAAAGGGALSANARRVLEARYLRRDAARRVIETPDELFRRVARAVAHAELLLGSAREAARWEERFHELLVSLDFLPNSPTLMNAGTPLGQLAACFVLPVEDTMESIFDAVRAMALLQRAGGGTGFTFSHLRPRGDTVRSTGGEASGPVSFLRIFDCATENIKQGGRRRGANMGVLRVDHPDVLDFVDAKLGGGLANFNLSVGVTDAFMRAVEQDEAYELRHPVDGRVVGRPRARVVFDRIVDRCWRTGDPGLLYLDAVNRANPLPGRGPIEATNPCGEVPLLPWECCVLGSVNLAPMVRAADGELDWERLRRAVHTGVRFLDDVVEVNRAPLPAIAAAARATRKIGLGVMGFAECLLRLGVGYDSDAAEAWADRLMAFVAAEARAASRALAVERGVFPAWAESTHAARGERLRHATLLSIAPTGTIAIIAGTSSGIEPLFALAYRRQHSLGGEPLVEVNEVFLRALAASGADPTPVLDAVLATGTLAGVPGLPDDLRRRFVTATEIPVARQLRVQQAFQRHVDNAVAKTVNLPEDAGAERVAEAYLDAWRLGLKGVTLYRSGSTGRQVLTLGLGEDAIAREHFAKCDPGACRL